MSCKLKQTRTDKITTRSQGDLGLIEKYNTNLVKENYTYYSMNGYGIERTKFDSDLNHKWGCDFPNPSGPSGPSGGEVNEYYTEDYIGPRTQFDMDLQKKWAPGCPSCPCSGGGGSYPTQQNTMNYAPNHGVHSMNMNTQHRAHHSGKPYGAPHTREGFNDYLQSFNDTDNQWSYYTKGL